MRKLTYYVAASLDGYIAGPGGEYDVFDASQPVIDYITEHVPETLPDPARAALGITAPGTTFDTVLMGRSTYDVGLPHGLTSPYSDLDQIVFSTSMDRTLDERVRLEVSDPARIVEELKAQPGLGIWLCGGGRLAGALLDQIDILTIKRQPLVMGGGRPMITGTFSPQHFELVDRETVGSITVETHHRMSPATSNDQDVRA